MWLHADKNTNFQSHWHTLALGTTLSSSLHQEWGRGRGLDSPCSSFWLLPSSYLLFLGAQVTLGLMLTFDL